MYKNYCTILNKRLSQWEEQNEILHDAQNGFRKNRSTVDHISSLTSIIESNRKAMNRNWSNQKANPALKTKAGNK